ncbi:MAG TPA: hypothetical protein VFD74_05475, partial [Thermoleophilia bacterium]|nr:hypothetical protein [Thermoleophilia bacterium]
GLVAGLNPLVRLRYECKRSRGDARCVGVYTWKVPPLRPSPTLQPGPAAASELAAQAHSSL